MTIEINKSETGEEQSEELEIQLSDATKFIQNIIFQGQYSFAGDIGLEMGIPYIKAKRFKRKGVLEFDIPSDDEHLSEFDKVEIKKSDGFNIDKKSDKVIMYIRQKEVNKLYRLRITGLTTIFHNSDFPASIIILKPANQNEVTYKYSVIEE